jgi:hypothetical protein
MGGALRLVLLVFFDFGLSGLLVLGLDDLDAFLELLDDGLALVLLVLLDLLRLVDLVVVSLLEAVEEVFEHGLLLAHLLLLALAHVHLRLEGSRLAVLLARGLVLLVEVVQLLVQLLQRLLVAVLRLHRLLLQLLLCVDFKLLSALLSWSFT